MTLPMKNLASYAVLGVTFAGVGLAANYFNQDVEPMPEAKRPDF